MRFNFAPLVSSFLLASTVAARPGLGLRSASEYSLGGDTTILAGAGFEFLAPIELLTTYVTLNEMGKGDSLVTTIVGNDEGQFVANGFTIVNYGNGTIESKVFVAYSDGVKYFYTDMQINLGETVLFTTAIQYNGESFVMIQGPTGQSARQDITDDSISFEPTIAVFGLGEMSERPENIQLNYTKVGVETSSGSSNLGNGSPNALQANGISVWNDNDSVTISSIAA